VYFDFDMRIFNGSVTQAYLGIVWRIWMDQKWYAGK
jgi:hypothetical protein